MRFRPVLVALGTLLALTAGLLSVATAGPAAAAPPAIVGEHVPGVVLVGFEPGASADVRQDARRAVGALANRPVSPLAQDVEVLTLPAGADVARAMQALEARPGVRYAEPDYLYRLDATSNDTCYVATSGCGGWDLWGMYGDLTTPTNQYGSQAGEAWAAGYTGSRSVYVGILDSGMSYGDIELAPNAGNPAEIASNGVDDDGNGRIDDTYGWDFYDGDNDPSDDNSHGTHVAGTIGGLGGNGLGVAGVNWQVRMLAAKIGGADGYISSSAAVAALDYFTDLRKNRGVNIVATNNSWGGGSYSSTLLAAITRGGDAGILFVAAAGNDTVDNDATPYYPSGYACTTTAAGAARGWDCVVSVAAIDRSGALATFSNWGATQVDLGAPGVSIVSTLPGNYLGRKSGTSMATPHVTGAAALCASISPGISASQIRQAIVGSTIATSSLSGKTVTGGRLDVASMASTCAGSARTLSVTKSGLGAITSDVGGIDCGSTCSATVNAGTTITLTATNASGYRFSSWTNCPAPSANTCTVTLTSSRTVAATFTQTFFTLTVSKTSLGTGTGTITSSPTGISCGSTCARSFAADSLVTLTAAPASGSVFVGWSANCAPLTATTCRATMDVAKTVTATFQGVRTLTVAKSGGPGTVTSNVGGIDCGSTCSATVNYGTNVILTATPATGYRFASWTNCPSISSNTCTAAMTTTRTITANFAQITYALTVSRLAVASGSGSVSSSPSGISCGSTCSKSYAVGTIVRLTAAAASGSVFTGWSGNCAPVTATTCDVTMDAAKTVTATFTKTLILTVSKTNGSYGTVTSSPAGISCGSTCSFAYAYGTSVVLTASPITGRTFASWSNCPSPSGATCTVSLTAARTVTANFA